MAEADCELCAMAGYRSCDTCGQVIFQPADLTDEGDELCLWCLNELDSGPL